VTLGIETNLPQRMYTANGHVLIHHCSAYCWGDPRLSAQYTFPIQIFPFSFGEFSCVCRPGQTPRLVGWYAFRRMEVIKGGMVFAIFSPELVLHHNKLKWIPSPTSPPPKSPPIAMAEVPEAMLTALSPTPLPLTPPPTWMAEALEATLTALLPKWRTTLLPLPHHYCAFSPRRDILDRFTKFFLPFTDHHLYDHISFSTLLHESGHSPSRVNITYAGLRAAFDFTLCCFISERFIFRQVVFGFGEGAGDGWFKYDDLGVIYIYN
jgi:hypothetical protein